MPRGDGTGPMGWGPGSGRGAGFCAGFNRPGFANPVRGGFRGSGFWGPRQAPPRQTPAPADELENLQNQASFLKERIAQVEARLNELQNEEDKQ